MTTTGFLRKQRIKTLSGYILCANVFFSGAYPMGNFLLGTTYLPVLQCAPPGK